ncbi:galactosylceramidase [Planctomycetota bacterium]
MVVIRSITIKAQKFFTYFSLAIAMALIQMCLTFCETFAGTSTSVQVISVDFKDEGRIFEGIGCCSAGASSKLLIDYPEPYRGHIIDYLFKPLYGAGLDHLKIEIGSGTNSTDGTEPSHARTRAELENPKAEYYQRSYEWWLMKEAKKRNKNIYLDCLEWGAPAWIGGGEFYSQDNADYIVAFIKSAKKYHGLTIDYTGIWNEKEYDAEWIKLLRLTLDRNGLKDIKIAAADIVGGWHIVDNMLADNELFDAIDVVTVHYPYWDDYKSPQSAKECGKPLWSGEDGPWRADWEGACALARIYNRNYITGKMTKTVIWPPTTSFYENLPYGNAGLILANSPWSGHYELQPAFWATAHTGQFVEPGWQYLDSGCGYFENGGSYVTLKKPEPGGDYSIIIETTDASENQEVAFKLSEGLSIKKLSVWRTNLESFFACLTDINPKNNSFTITLDAGSIYSLTTTAGQQRPKEAGPVESGFPFPYEDDFESYDTGKLPKYFMDQGGVFEVVKRLNGGGKCLRQAITEESPMRHWFSPSPETIVGDLKWKDYEVSSDFYIENEGFVYIFARIGAIKENKSTPNAYYLKVDQDGNWELSVAGDLLGSGTISFSINSWHNLKLKVIGENIMAIIDGIQAAAVCDSTFKRGMVGLGSSWSHCRFDNFSVQPVTIKRRF